jgi:O-antigen ligase
MHDLRHSRRETWRRVVLPLATALVAALLCLIVFYAKGGLAKNDLDLGSITTFEMLLTLGGGLLVASVVLLAPTARPALGKPGYGQWPLALLLTLTGLTALSAVWSVQPDESWQEASLLLAYSALFAAAVVLARVAPRRWEAVLGGVLLASLVVCGYALLTKVLPEQLDANDTYARLRVPYGYWNAIGLTAAMGVVACLWLGAKRAGHALLNALAYPAMGLMLVTLLLAYSRGALIAVGVGIVLWLCITPLRLRGAALLLSSGIGAALVVGWTFAQHALSNDGVPLGERAQAGAELGVLLAALLLALTACGVAINFAIGRRAPRPQLRRRLGIVLLSLPLLAVLAVLAGLAHSERGLTGSIAHDVSALTNPNAPVPKNTPGRLTSVGSVRARYWKEALEVFAEQPALGAGGGGYETARLRHRQETLDVKNAHGFIVETLADLGLVGLLVVLALLAVWLAAAGRATHPFNRRWQRWSWRPIAAPYTPERIGLLTMLCVVVTFGVHSLVDWTWYVPGDACVALLCAGWLAGRGPLAGETVFDAGAALDAGVAFDAKAAPAVTAAPEAKTAPADARPPTWRPTPARSLLAAAVIVGTLLAAWMQWQPLRSADASNDALALLASNPTGARAQAQTAVARDPLSAQALFTLATVEQRSGEAAQAQATLQRAVRLQPSNPQTWVALGEYDLQTGDTREALKALRAAVYLNPEAVAPESAIAEDP